MESYGVLSSSKLCTQKTNVFNQMLIYTATYSFDYGTWHCFDMLIQGPTYPSYESYINQDIIVRMGELDHCITSSPASSKDSQWENWTSNQSVKIMSHVP